MHPESISGGRGSGSPQPSPFPSQCNASHLRHALPLLTAGHSLTPGPFCALLDDSLLSSLSVGCTRFRNHNTESDTPHLPTVIGVCGPSGAQGPKEGVVRPKTSVDTQGGQDPLSCL